MNIYSSVETKNSRFLRVCTILFLVFSLVSVFFSVVFLYMRLNIFDYGLYYSKHFPYVKDSRIVMVDFYMSGCQKKNDVYNENGKYVFEGGNPFIGEEQTVPNVNLQWFFNWYYKDLYK